VHLEPRKATIFKETQKRLAAEGDDGAPPITQLARTFPALADGPTYPNFSALRNPVQPRIPACIRLPQPKAQQPKHSNFETNRT